MNWLDRKKLQTAPPTSTLQPGLQFPLQIALLHTSQWEKKTHHSGSEVS